MILTIGPNPTHNYTVEHLSPTAKLLIYRCNYCDDFSVIGSSEISSHMLIHHSDKSIGYETDGVIINWSSSVFEGSEEAFESFLSTLPDLSDDNIHWPIATEFNLSSKPDRIEKGIGIWKTSNTFVGIAPSKKSPEMIGE